MNRQRKICFVVTEPMTVKAFLVDQLRALSRSYELTLVTGDKSESLLTSLNIVGHCVWLPIERALSPRRDVVATAKLYGILKRGRFDSVHSVTPKAGLLTALAALLAGIPLRTHTFTGQVWVTKRGLMGTILRWADRAIAALDTHLLADSRSQREFLESHDIVRKGKCDVLADGSISGVDLERFKPDGRSRDRMRIEHGLTRENVLLLFVGRLTRDKGVTDLVRAFAAIHPKTPKAALWFVGPDEGNLQAELIELASGCAHCIRFFGATDTPESFMAAADLLVLPSYREGFGSVVIEAAAVGVPAAASRIYGLTDAIEEGVTGLFHSPRDVDGLAEQLMRAANDPSLRQRLGQRARLRATERFSKDVLTSAMEGFYSELFRSGLRCPQRGWRYGLKRAFDTICAAAGLIVFSPILAALALCVLLINGRPILFRQVRPGRHARPFTLIKFRTMRDLSDVQGNPLADEDRLTKFGAFLRTWSLDELPQLWNVICGDMSFVGPRALLVEYLDRYTPEQARRHEAIPGITGWAQINGRNELSWEERFKLDTWYVEHWSLWLDLKILLLSPLQVLSRRGISRQGHATMPKFIGLSEPTKQHE